MAEDNYKRLRAELDGKLKADTRLKAIAAKISAGTADFKDTSEYTRIVARYMGEVISSNIGSITNPLGKEMVCKALLRDEYESINGVLGEVQTSIDDKLGIHIKPVKPAFPTERVDKAAHSLEDPTVPESTIKRRARSTSENITNSFHDDYIKENARFRSKAGLKCYITRETDGKCCPWCSGIAGRYEYGAEPHDIYRRHDNCGCSVTYENGRQRQDVWSKRTWEAPEPNAGAEKPTVFSREQAERLNAENMPKRFTGGVNTPTVDDGSRFYRKVELGDENTQISRGDSQINAIPVLSSNNKLFISDSLSPKPKLIHQVDNALTEVLRSMGISDADNLPEVYIISDSEMAVNAVAAYRAGDNKFFVNADFAYYTRDKVPEIMQEFVCPNDYRSTYFHEMYHWLDAQEYREKVGAITKETYQDYDSFVQKKAKKALDKLDKSGYNITEISDYARDSYEDGLFDETYTEYRVLMILSR